MMRLMVGHVFHLEMQIVMGKLRVLGFAVPFGGRETLESAAQRVSFAEVLSQHVGSRPLRQRDKYLVAIWIVVGDDGRLFDQHQAEALAEDRLHPLEVTD